jgi:cell division protein FtsB
VRFDGPGTDRRRGSRGTVQPSVVALTCQLRAATLPEIVKTPRSTPEPPRRNHTATDADEVMVGLEAAETDDPTPTAATDGIDLSALSIAGITRRRVGWVAAALLSAWIVVVFARQAGDAASASNRAEQTARDNAALAAEVASLERELAIIEKPAYVSQQARAYGLGTPQEIPFTLDAAVPTPGPDAPGSAALRVGAHEDRPTPLESWLSLLFGPAN